MSEEYKFVQESDWFDCITRGMETIDRNEERARVFVRLVKERDAALEAYVERHFQECDGCGVTSDSLREEVREEVRRLLTEGKLLSQQPSPRGRGV